MLDKLIKTQCGQAAINSNLDLKNQINILDVEGLIDGKPAKPRSTTDKFLDSLYETYINGMLSSGTTQGVNIVGNTSPILTRPIETIASAIAEVPRRLFSNPQEVITFREAAAELQGLAEGFSDATAFLWRRATKPGVATDQILPRYAPEKLVLQSKAEHMKDKRRVISGALLDDTAFSNKEWLRAALDFMGAGINIPGKMLTVSDTAFKIMHYRAEVHKQAWRQAFSERGESAAKTYSQVKTSAFNRSNEDIVSKALADADDRTYTRRPGTELERAMAEGGHKLFGMRWIVPFRRTMVNLIAYNLGRTPLALMNPSSTTVRQISAGGVERAEAIGRVAAGTLMLSTLAYAVGDKLIGAAPRDFDEKILWESQGNKPYTIQLDDKTSIDLEAFGPFGITLKALADYKRVVSEIDYEAHDNPDGIMSELANEFSFAIADIFLNEHWAGNILEGANAISRSRIENSWAPLVTYAAKIGQNILVPNIVAKDVQRGEGFLQPFRELGWYDPTDPIKRDIPDPISAFMARIPGISSKLTPNIDIWGDPVKYDNFVDSDIADPLTGKGPIIDEMRRVGVHIPKMSRTQMGVKMTPEEYARAKQYAGKGAMGLPALIDTITERMNSSYYNSPLALKEDQAMVIERAIQEHRRAGVYALLQDPDFDFGQRVQMQRELEMQSRNITQ